MNDLNSRVYCLVQKCCIQQVWVQKCRISQNINLFQRHPHKYHWKLYTDMFVLMMRIKWTKFYQYYIYITSFMSCCQPFKRAFTSVSRNYRLTYDSFELRRRYFMLHVTRHVACCRSLFTVETTKMNDRRTYCNLSIASKIVFLWGRVSLFAAPYFILGLSKTSGSI